MAPQTPSPYTGHAVRYQVRDVARSVAFYTQRLGFEVRREANDAFAMVGTGDLSLYLSGPKSSGAQPLPDGRRQEPGGSNRLVLHVADLEATIQALKQAGVSFRNALLSGPGGKQVQIEDPDGNPLELFQPAP